MYDIFVLLLSLLLTVLVVIGAFMLHPLLGTILVICIILGIIT